MNNVPKSSQINGSPSSTITFGRNAWRSSIAATLFVMTAISNPLDASEIDGTKARSEFPGASRGWAEWGLVDFHGRPKFIIGEERRPLRKLREKADATERFAVMLPVTPGND